MTYLLEPIKYLNYKKHVVMTFSLVKSSTNDRFDRLLTTTHQAIEMFKQQQSGKALPESAQNTKADVQYDIHSRGRAGLIVRDQ